MRAVVQVSKASQVMVEDQQVGAIEQGLVVLLGVKKGDTEQDVEYMMEKIINLRIFEDEEGKMNRSLLDIGGQLLLISQFTLYGDARKGRRPSFTDAEDPGRASRLFNYSVEYARKKNIQVATGLFGADMQVHIINDGPCTILIDSERLF